MVQVRWEKGDHISGTGMGAFYWWYVGNMVLGYNMQNGITPSSFKSNITEGDIMIIKVQFCE